MARKRLLFSNYSPEEPPFPLVIPTGAKRSGETCGFAALSSECFSTERSAAERSLCGCSASGMLFESVISTEEVMGLRPTRGDLRYLAYAEGTRAHSATSTFGKRLDRMSVRRTDPTLPLPCGEPGPARGQSVRGLLAGRLQNTDFKTHRLSHISCKGTTGLCEVSPPFFSVRLSLPLP